jgi:2-polyprenyl-6-methoxyphenol hydroxylase-like FAD-dependent oxidoreductase
MIVVAQSHRSINRWDVIVVGARAAGAATAMLLARAGRRVLCVDRSRYGGDTMSTHALMRGGVLQLQRWGLLDDVVAAGTPPVRRTVFHYGAETVGVSIRPSAGVDALYAPRRTVIDAMLVDAAQRAGATVEFGTAVTGLHRSSDGRVDGVVLGSRRADAVHGVARVEYAPLVIGADGRGSLVARLSGADISVAGRSAGSFLYGYWADFPTDGYEWFYGDGITAGAIPTNAGLTCVFIGGPPARIQQLVEERSAPAAFAALAEPAGIGHRIQRAARAEPVRYVRALPPSYLRTAHGPGWALVGDAGHWLDPMSTHGMTSAFRDAELLAQAVLSAPAGSPAQLSALSGYQTTRDRLSSPMIQVTEEIAAYRWDLTRIRTLLRTLSSAMTDEVEALGALDQAA